MPTQTRPATSDAYEPNSRGVSVYAARRAGGPRSIDVPGELWLASNVVLDTRTDAVSCDSETLAVRVDVAPQSSLQVPPIPEPDELAVVAA
jgi:hypothetical protein